MTILITYLSVTYPQSVLYLYGDFNQLDLTSFLTDTGLCQIDTGPTRGRHALDRFITNSLWIQNQVSVAKSCLKY